MKKIVLTREEIEAMPREKLEGMLKIAQKVEARAVVMRADGTIKYDNPELAGTYGEEHLHGHR